MKRPLVDDFELAPAARQLLVHAVYPTWRDRLRMKLDAAVRRAFRAPVSGVHTHTNNACALFNNIDEVMGRLNLSRVMPHLRTNTKLFHPVDAPIIDNTSTFAQWGLIWEPVSEDRDLVPVKSRQTLNIEIGAGYYLLSLTFTPQPDLIFEPLMQLDSVAIHRGHDVYYLPLSLNGSLEETRETIKRTAQVMDTARATITMIDEDYPQAEMTLADGLRPIIESLEADGKDSRLSEDTRNNRTGTTVAFGNMRP